MLRLILSPLAQQSATEESSTSIALWIAVLLVLVLLFFGALVWVRRRLNPNEDFHAEGFTLSDLRAMHKAGHLSDEEFERAKEKMVASLHAAQMRRDSARTELEKQQQQQQQQRGMNLR